MDEKLREIDFLMYFHTSIRNLALYISVALAILAVSRAYRGKNKLYNVSFIIISLLFLLISAYKNYYLILTLDKMKKKNDINELYTNEVSLVPSFVLFLNTIIISFCLYTLYREYFN
tara:strand:- start:2450 stop:2800 length:351 start_codon:yes stop_codon:yes gene_type:complete